MGARGGQRGAQSTGGQPGEAPNVKNDEDDQHSAATAAFVDITAAAPDVARHFLEAYGWDIEGAVTGYLEHGGQGVVDGTIGASGPGRAQHQQVVEIDDGGDVGGSTQDIEVSDNSDEQLQTLASYRSRRTATVDYREQVGDEAEDGDYLEDDEDIYGEEEERFKYGRRNRRGHRRSMRRLGQGDPTTEDDPVQSIPQAVLNLPDVNLEEQKMLMAAMTGQAYDGNIPDFSNHVPYVPKPLSPGAMARQMLRDEQDLAFQESLELDRERQRQAEMAQIEDMEREESMRREQKAALDLLEEKKRRLPAEPAADDPAGLSLVIRLPSGTRLKRRFSGGDSVDSLFDYVDVEGGDEIASGAYRLVTTFPRRLLSSNEHKRLGELGFQKQEALFVEST